MTIIAKTIETIEIHDYTDDTVEVPMHDNTRFIHVKVVSGDEIISMYDENMNLLAKYDSCPGGRSKDWYDGCYIIDVASDDFTIWLERTSSYNMFLNKELHRIFKN